MNDVNQIPAGYRKDAKGRLVPENMIKPQELLEDQTVAKIAEHARELSAQIARFKGHTFDDFSAFMDTLAEEYGASKGGRKGNVTIMSYDGCTKVVVQVQESLTFGPELQIAKKLFDKCISTWSANADEKVKALVEHAFQVDQEGRINRAELFRLRRLNIDDDGWRAAVQAINDSIRVEGSKQYVRFYERPHPEAAWRAITIDLASAVAPASDTEAA